MLTKRKKSYKISRREVAGIKRAINLALKELPKK